MTDPIELAREVIAGRECNGDCELERFDCDRRRLESLARAVLELAAELEAFKASSAEASERAVRLNKDRDAWRGMARALGTKIETLTAERDQLLVEVDKRNEAVDRGLTLLVKWREVAIDSEGQITALTAERDRLREALRECCVLASQCLGLTRMADEPRKQYEDCIDELRKLAEDDAT